MDIAFEKLVRFQGNEMRTFMIPIQDMEVDKDVSASGTVSSVVSARKQEVASGSGNQQQPAKETTGCVRDKTCSEDIIEFPLVRGGCVEDVLDRPPTTFGEEQTNFPGPHQKEKRNKPSKLFFITVDVPAVYTGIRRDFLYNFSGVESYCIGLEKHKNAKVSLSYHLHAYLKFIEGKFVGDLADELHAIFDGLTVNVQCCRSERNVLKYITKEDKDALHNVSVDKLNFYYRLHFWARNTLTFRYDDPFVVEHKHIYHFLEKAFYDCKRECSLNLKCYLGEVYGGWGGEVISWWNNFLTSEKKFKKQQLYLWGLSNVGKSTLVEKVIGDKFMRYGFEVGDGRFAFTGLREDYHRFMIFEEFDWNEWKGYSRYLKRLLEGRRFSADMKGSVAREIMWVNKPIIIVSNGMEIDDQAILNRLKIVQCYAPYWEEKGEGFVREIKKEACDIQEENIEEVELSSEEEENI